MTLFWIAFWWWCAWRIARSARRCGSLNRYAPAERCPSLTVIFAARNEAATVGPAVRTLLDLDYPDLTVVAVDDRSEDATGQVLGALGDPRLRVVRIDELPEGWLGKTHALWEGARHAPGELLLFTDADVHFAPDSLRRAVTALSAHGADHLSLGPRLLVRGFWENLFVSFFGASFCLRYRPELASGPDPRYSMGVGAFNLVRRSAYERMDGHRALRLQVLDDMGLGRLVKARGFRQLYLDAPEFVQVRWIEGGLGGAARGLEKNAYAGLDYSPLMTLGCVLAFGGAHLALLWLGWPARLAILAAMLRMSRVISRGLGASPWSGLGYPLAALAFCGVILRSAWITERSRGVRWRGTFYPLSMLRRHTLDSI